jgi:hypothetical protein
VVCSNNHSN